MPHNEQYRGLVRRLPRFAGKLLKLSFYFVWRLEDQGFAVYPLIDFEL